MIFALGVIVKTTALLALAGLMTLGLRRASASTRHAVWAIALLGALMLPAAIAVLPDVNLPLLPEEPVVRATPPPLEGTAERITGNEPNGPPYREASASLTAPSAPSAQPPLLWQGGEFRLLWILWAIGALTVLVRLLIGSMAVRNLARRSVPLEEAAWLDVLDDLKAQLGLSRPVRLRVADRVIPPMTWGVFRHVILLPVSAREWNAARRRFVLAHELAHVQRNDGIVQMLLQAVCSLYWFNPLVWHAARRVRIERECACDDRVVKLGCDADDYADHLLQVARTINPGGGLSMATVAMAHRSQLETRLLSILDTRTRRQTISRLALAGVAGCVAAITLSVASIHVTAKPGTIASNAINAAPGFAPPDFNTLLDPAQHPFVTVRGTIREWATEAPLPNAMVSLIPLHTLDGQTVPRYEAESHTDGSFAIRDLPPGQYRIVTARSGFVTVHSAAEPTQLTVLAGRHAEELNIHMLKGPAISGRIFDEAGDLKESAHVELLRMDIRGGRRALLPSDISMVTDNLGEYRLFGLHPGEYYLRVRPRAGRSDFLPVYFPGVTDSRYATPISVRAGADISGIDLTLTKGDLHSVRLNLEIETPAPPNPELSFYITSRNAPEGGAAGAVQFHSAGANRYVSPLLAPGTYDIEVYLRDPDPIRWARTTVEIVDRDVDAGTLVIGPGAWIRGRVTATETLPVSVRKRQLLVILRPLDGSIFLLPSAQVSDDGTFVIPRVPERRFRIDLTGLPPEVYFASARYDGREVRESGILVSENSHGVVELSIAGSGGVVAGVVRTAKDEPISTGAVVLIPADRDNLNLYRTASTDQFGVFSIAGVPPGEYGVLAWKGGVDKTYLDPVFLKAVENQITKVVVQRGFTNTINVRAIAK